MLASHALILLALAAPALATPPIPKEFFEAQKRIEEDGKVANRFRAWMAQHGVTFGTKGEFDRRLRIFAENRYEEGAWGGGGRSLSFPKNWHFFQLDLSQFEVEKGDPCAAA